MRDRRLLHKAGFTLLELVVTLGVTMMLSTLVLVYSSGSRQEVALTVEVTKLSELISRAKSLTIARYDRISACGYGVHLDPTGKYYALISYQAPDCSQLNALPVQTELEKFPLGTNVEFDAGPNQASDIYFIPPAPEVAINLSGSVVRDQAGYVYLKTSTSGGSHQISVTPAGQINF